MKARGTPKGRSVDPRALQEIATLLGAAARRRDLLIEHLHRIQDSYGHITAARLAAIVHRMLHKDPEKRYAAMEAVARDVDIPISVDTYKPRIARKAIRAGAVIVNDVRGLRDPEMVRVVANSGAGAVIMHMKGEPATMQENPHYDDVVAEVKAFLAERLGEAVSHGVAMESTVVDPGFGFGKAPRHNTTLLHSLREIRAIGRPVLAGASRKSFLASVHPTKDGEGPEASLAAAAIGVQNGADILRVHDVAKTVQFVRTLDTSMPTQQ